jgi:VanZ family protein
VRTYKAFIIPVGWLLIITFLLCIPGTELPKITWDDKIWLDKWVHVFLFMILVILWSKGYSGKKRIHATTRKIFFQIMILGFLYGILMEAVQGYFILYRSFDLMDILADGVGCFIGYLISLKRFVKT